MPTTKCPHCKAEKIFSQTGMQPCPSCGGIIRVTQTLDAPASPQIPLGVVVSPSTLVRNVEPLQSPSPVQIFVTAQQSSLSNHREHKQSFWSSPAAVAIILGIGVVFAGLPAACALMWVYYDVKSEVNQAGERRRGELIKAQRVTEKEEREAEREAERKAAKDSKRKAKQDEQDSIDRTRAQMSDLQREFERTRKREE